jgi:hypothetical protein
MYTMTLKSVANPDYGQRGPQSDEITVEGQTLKEMRAHCELYIRIWDLGGGNWVDPIVMEDGKKIGRFSYNGRLWSLKKSADMPRGTEIVFG